MDIYWIVVLVSCWWEPDDDEHHDHVCSLRALHHCRTAAARAHCTWNTCN